MNKEFTLEGAIKKDKNAPNRVLISVTDELNHIKKTFEVDEGRYAIDFRDMPGYWTLEKLKDKE